VLLEHQLLIALLSLQLRTLSSVTRKLKLGYSGMILVPHMVSKVMKSKSTQLVCIMVTVTGHHKSLGTHTILLHSEEVSKFGKELAKDVTELCIKNTISWWTRVSDKEN
jgi:hypothetical protein